jgi:hypothetical protein
MSAAAPAPAARAAYRALLRAVARRLTAVNGNTVWRDAVHAQFRAGAAERDPAAAAAAIARAEDMALMINAVNDHKARAAHERCNAPHTHAAQGFERGGSLRTH